MSENEIESSKDEIEPVKSETERRRFRVSWKSFLLGILAAVIILAVAFLVYMILPFTSEPSSPYSLSFIRKSRAIQQLIDEEYFGDVDPKAETDMMYLGMVSALGDKYSTYYTREQYEEIRMENDGQMKGIGVTISQDTDSGYLLVQDVVADSPAEKAGVKKGDLITKILGEDTKGMTSSDAVKLIQGSEDDTVTLSVIHEGEEKAEDLSMEKARIDREVVAGAMLDGNIGYIAISSFNRLTADQFKDVYDQLNEKKMAGLVIDLRGNLGGLVDACCDTLNLFMPEGPLVYEKDKQGNENHRDSDGDSPIDIPLVILVNENTASASEMFTGAVQDYGVGTVVGTQTYGKGIEQNSYTLSDGSVLKITTIHYYTPDHRDINGTGITPDVEVEADEDADSDTQLDAAMAVLKREMSGEDQDSAVKAVREEEGESVTGVASSSLEIEPLDGD